MWRWGFRGSVERSAEAISIVGRNLLYICRAFLFCQRNRMYRLDENGNAAQGGYPISPGRTLKMSKKFAVIDF